MVALWWNREGKPLGDVRLKNEQQVHRIAERRSSVWMLRKVRPDQRTGRWNTSPVGRI